MKGKRQQWSVVWSLFLGISMLCGHAGSVAAQEAETPQGNRVVASLAIVSVEGGAEILSKVDAERSRGEARILADAWKAAIPRTPLGSGDQIRTSARGSLKLQLGDGTLMTLDGDSAVVVEELRSSRGETPPTTQIKLEYGRLTTEQSTKILGQTQQLIRTDNGTINTSLGEVEVRKPSMEFPQVAALGDGLLLAQKAPKDETYVSLGRGGATVQSSGVGRIIASSMTTPETCIDADGVKFTLTDPNDEVTITKLEDEDAYLVTSEKQFHLLVGTEGTVNSIDIITQDSEAAIDVEGIAVAEQKANGLSNVNVHPLLTVGVQTYAVKVKFNCTDETPRGLGDVGIQGDATVLRTNLGPETGQPLPSGSSGSGRIPGRSDASLSVAFGGDITGCGPFDVLLTVRNTGEQSNAEDVEVSIAVTSGSEYVAALSPALWTIGSIPPGTAASTTIRVDINDAWLTAEAGAEIKLEATVTRETSRPDHTVGRRDTVTFSNPGECDAAPPAAQETPGEEAPATAATSPSQIPVTHNQPREPSITRVDIISSVAGGGCGAGWYNVTFQFDYQNYLPSIMGGKSEYRISQTGFTNYSPNYYNIPDSTGQLQTIAYNYPAGGGGGNLQLETGTFQTRFCFRPAAGSTSVFLGVELRDLEGNSSGFGNSQCEFNVTTGASVTAGPVCQ